MALPITAIDRTYVRDLLGQIRDSEVRDEFLEHFKKDKELEQTLALGTALVHDFSCEAIHLSQKMVEDPDGMSEAMFKELDDVQSDIYTAAQIYTYVYARMKQDASN